MSEDDCISVPVAARGGGRTVTSEAVPGDAALSPRQGRPALRRELPRTAAAAYLAQLRNRPGQQPAADWPLVLLGRPLGRQAADSGPPE